ncbi:flagellar export chaperone FliS [Massilia cavernae]|uniref:Flagellar secretion chaperone FliS n=1 Tax=Massilia cavernae TaxID=2320864 RepID=A0A418XSN1_9BURK|nr:flagellar export chaperone FliS [Massilia cavernae]RJG15592.1 flagellar export chaperone FliS [Massilia cavernae]
MFGSMKSGANAYAKVGIETGVMAASPHKLIVMLYDGALTAIRNAQAHMKSGNIPEKGSQISKAIQIIENGLRASLDREVGGQIAQGLDSLYEYMGHRLLMANLNNQPELLDEVHRLLSELRDAWNQIGNTPPAPVVANTAPVLASA